MTALDVAVDGQHKACVDFLVSEQARTNGGQFHRAARLVQSWWKFRRYKVMVVAMQLTEIDGKTDGQAASQVARQVIDS